MGEPYAFSWIDPPRLAGLGRPDSLGDLVWLRRQGIEVLLTLTEDPLPKSWLEEAGILGVHVPIRDYEPPSLEQFRKCISNIRSAHARNMGVAVHCFAGRGRTGTVLAGFLTTEGVSPEEAIQTIRRLRPGSIETPAQEEAIFAFAADYQANPPETPN